MTLECRDALRARGASEIQMHTRPREALSHNTSSKHFQVKSFVESCLLTENAIQRVTKCLVDGRRLDEVRMSAWGVPKSQPTVHLQGLRQQVIDSQTCVTLVSVIRWCIVLHAGNLAAVQRTNSCPLATCRRQGHARRQIANRRPTTHDDDATWYSHHRSSVT